MDAAPDWRSAFPLQSAVDASEALLQGWHDLATVPRPGFNRRTREPRLTKRLKTYVENYVAHDRGLLGMWAAEDIIGDIDPETGELVEERRTDIVYGWNDAASKFELVFEFKRLRKGKSDRDEYLGEHGLARFVTGLYSRHQAIAAMVGILLAPEAVIVPPIRAALSEPGLANELRLRKDAGGMPYTEPSTLFPQAVFDTDHDRDPVLAPAHGYIRVAHFFVTFGQQNQPGI